MITTENSVSHQECWILCSQGLFSKNCSWFSYLPTVEVCNLWHSCHMEENESLYKSSWITSHTDCYAPDGEYNPEFYINYHKILYLYKQYEI